MGVGSVKFYAKKRIYVKFTLKLANEARELSYYNSFSFSDEHRLSTKTGFFCYFLAIALIAAGSFLKSDNSVSFMLAV